MLKRQAGVPLAPKDLRSSFIPFLLSDTNSDEALKKAVAHAMRHSPAQQGSAAYSRCATQLDRPDRMARQGLRLRLRMGMKVVMWARVRTHTHTHTHTRMGYWGGCWIGSRKVGRGCGRRSGMGSGFVFARRSTRCVRGLPRGSLSIYLSIYLSNTIPSTVCVLECQ